MARTYAPLMTAIWRDEEFIALPARAQRLYLVLISQADVSYCGVLGLTVKRWSTLAPDTDPSTIDQDLRVLEQARLIVVDRSTEEVLVRSFVKHNRVRQQPQLARAMSRQFSEIHSPEIRAAVRPLLPDAGQNPSTEPLAQGARQGAPQDTDQAAPEGASRPGVMVTRVSREEPEPKPIQSTPAKGGDDDENPSRLVDAVCEHIAAREYNDRLNSPRAGKVRDPDAWYRSAVERARHTHEPTIARLIRRGERDPGRLATAVLAAAHDPPLPRAYDLDAVESCEQCTSGWRETDGGAVRCDHGKQGAA